MTTCRFCAEEIQDAAIVCKHCRRDLVVSPPTSTTAAVAAAAPRRRFGFGKVLLLGVLAFVAFTVYSWATSADSVDLGKAQELKALLVRDKVLQSHTCNPNRVTLPAVWWASVTPERRQENFAQAFARLCIADGAGRDMTVVDASGRTLAYFDGWTIKH